KQLISFFAGDLTNDERLIQIANRKQKPGEDFATFALEIYYMFEPIQPPKSEAERCQYIIENSHHSIRSRLRIFSKASLKLQLLLEKERQIRRDLDAGDDYFQKDSTVNNVSATAPKKGADLPQVEELNDPKVDNISPRLCHRCKKPGHIAKDCYSRL
ncbi:unnamed protein product, partial [Allacma fusca]